MLRDFSIYEYNKNYCFIFASPQSSKSLDGPSEDVGLTGAAEVNAVDEQLGNLAIESIERYGSIRPSHSPWELKELRNNRKKWTGAKSYAALVRNYRLVVGIADTDKNTLRLIPYDNHNINKWETPLDEKNIVIPLDSTPVEIGAAIKTTFEACTYHPQRNG